MSSKIPLWLKLILCPLIIAILGGASGVLTASSIPEWYATLRKPVGTPPNWLFGPAWTLLYTLMGIAFALVWHNPDGGATRKKGMRIFIFQFVLNLIWTPLFFGLHQMGWALVCIVLLWVMIAINIVYFGRVRKVCGWLLVPYLCWVTYATYLNASFLFLNR